MNINSFSSIGIANTVWSAVTRTLTADPATDAGSGTIVWAHAARTLTADPWTPVNANVALTSFATGTTVDLRPAAGKFRHALVVVTQAAAGVFVGHYDGTTFTAMQVTAIGGTVFGNNTMGPAVNNASGMAGHYALSGYDR